MCIVGAAALTTGCNSDERYPGQTGGGEGGASLGSASDGLTDGGSVSDSESADGTDGDEGGVSESLSGTTGDSESDSASAGSATVTASAGDGEGGETTGDSDSDGDCPAEDPLCAVPDSDREPVDTKDGLPSPLPGVYDDPKPAAADDEFRALIGFPIRDEAKLIESIKQMTDPDGSKFGEAMSIDTFMATHAPTDADFKLVRTWLTTRGFSVDFAATNRLLIQFSGTAEQWNATFGEPLLVCSRKNPSAGGDPYPVFCTDAETLALPKFVADRATGIVTADLPAKVGELPGEAGSVIDDHPGDEAYTPQQIAAAYGLTPLYEAGHTGEGVTLGVVAAATYHSKDLQTFWESFDVERELPVRVQVMEPIITRLTETIRDVQWATVMAPGAAVRVYEGPDARNTSLLYTFNEAVARNEVDVLTDSFDHREDSEPALLRHQYDRSAMVGSALGMTIVGASGNSARPDIPCSSPHLTCVGGTKLVLGDDDEVVSETAWEFSGSGDTLTFDVPWWQEGVAPNDTRAVCDVALNASEETPYWLRRFGEWEYTNGTSISAPVFAAIIAVIDSARLSEGKKRVGFFNPTLYRRESVRASFRDITAGATEFHAAGEGWDYPTGWGAPNAQKLYEALP